ncbi:hypothetical protein FRC03_008652 [Tulasnella sp. 419]|nr:hypothetical protein FRC03_008652 [Tulasnella sp. 419]
MKFLNFFISLLIVFIGASAAPVVDYRDSIDSANSLQELGITLRQGISPHAHHTRRSTRVKRAAGSWLTEVWLRLKNFFKGSNLAKVPKVTKPVNPRIPVEQFEGDPVERWLERGIGKMVDWLFGPRRTTKWD